MSTYLPYYSKEQFEAKKKNEIATKMSYYLKNRDVTFRSIEAIREVVPTKPGNVAFVLKVGDKIVTEEIIDRYYRAQQNVI